MSHRNPNPKDVPAVVEPPKMAMMTAADLPSEELMSELGIEPAWWPDFIRAVNFVVYNSAGMNISQAAETVGIDRQALYNAKWQGLVNAARRLLIGRAMLSAQSATLRVFEMYPQIIEKLLHTAMFAKRDSDSNDAIELINTMFIENAPKQRDVSAESLYLKEQPNFNPALPMRIAVDVTIKNPPAVAGGDSPSAIVDVEFNRDGGEDAPIDAAERPALPESIPTASPTSDQTTLSDQPTWDSVQYGKFGLAVPAEIEEGVPLLPPLPNSPNTREAPQEYPQSPWPVDPDAPPSLPSIE